MFPYQINVKSMVLIPLACLNPRSTIQGFRCGLIGRESTCNEGDLGSIPGLGRSPGEGKGYPLHYSGLENSMDYIVHGVAKSLTLVSDFHFFTFTVDQWGVKVNFHEQFCLIYCFDILIFNSYTYQIDNSYTQLVEFKSFKPVLIYYS